MALYLVWGRRRQNLAWSIQVWGLGVKSAKYSDATGCSDKRKSPMPMPEVALKAAEKAEAVAFRQTWGGGGEEGGGGG